MKTIQLLTTLGYYKWAYRKLSWNCIFMHICISLGQVWNSDDTVKLFYRTVYYRLYHINLYLYQQCEGTASFHALASISLFLFLFFNFILFLNFTILYWFCQISKWIHHRYTCVPHPEPSSFLPPHTIPLGRPSAPAPSIQYRASNLV